MEKRAYILVYSNDRGNLDRMEDCLSSLGHKLFLTSDVRLVVARTYEDQIDLVVLDVNHPSRDEIEAARSIKQNPKTKPVSILVLGNGDVRDARLQAFHAGADDFMGKPLDFTELKIKAETLLKVKAYNDLTASYQEQVEQEVGRRTGKFQRDLQMARQLSLDSIYRLSRAAEYRDEDTGVHIHRISQYTAAVATQLGVSPDLVEALLHSSPLHDVGKIGIPDRILLKPGKLDADEWIIMKKHTNIGAAILEGSDSEFIKLAEIIAMSHHEKWNGCGYPKGLKGNNIPLSGRIVAIADVFDALTCKRPYKDPMPLDKAFAIVEESEGSHFDPEIVHAFFAVKDKIIEIKSRNQDQGESELFKLAVKAVEEKKKKESD